MMINLLGGMDDEVPQMHDLATVVTHVRPGTSPAALLLQGEFDFITQTAATRRLAETLRQAGIPALYVEFPQTEHAWDIATLMGEVTGVKLPFVESHYAPPTTATLYDMEHGPESSHRGPSGAARRHKHHSKAGPAPLSL